MVFIVKQTIFVLLFTVTTGFAPVSISCRRALQLEAHESKGELGLTKFFGVVATISALSFGNMQAAHASPKVDDLSGMSLSFLVTLESHTRLSGMFLTNSASTTNDPVPPFSSSMEIAESIKVLDMSMPTYGDISNYKSSVENTKSLSVEGGEKMGIPTSKSKRSSSSSASSSSSSSNPMGSFLPSMNKKSAADKKAEKTKTYSSTPGYDF